MTKLEQVARAIASADGEDYMEDCARYDARAKAAIEAMRDPSDKMVDLAAMPYRHGNTVEFDALFRKQISGYWRTMIDAALTEKE